MTSKQSTVNKTNAPTHFLPKPRIPLVITSVALLIRQCPG